MNDIPLLNTEPYEGMTKQLNITIPNTEPPSPKTPTPIYLARLQSSVMICPTMIMSNPNATINTSIPRIVTA